MTIEMAERQRNLMYAPHYLAFSRGFYEGYELDVNLHVEAVVDGPKAIVADQYQVLVGGPMRLFKLFEETGDRVRSYATLVQRHPWYLLAREAMPDFQWDHLRGKEIIDFKEAPTPWLGLKYSLMRNGICESEVTKIGGLSVDEAIEQFKSGRGDYLLHPLHTAETLRREGHGFLVANLAYECGLISFTSFSVAQRFLEERHEDVIRLYQAFGDTLDWLHGHLDAGEMGPVAEALIPYFSDVPRETIDGALARYRDTGVWPRNPSLPYCSFDYYRSLLIGAGWIDGEASYEDITVDLPILQ